MLTNLKSIGDSNFKFILNLFIRIRVIDSVKSILNWVIIIHNDLFKIDSVKSILNWLIIIHNDLFIKYV